MRGIQSGRETLGLSRLRIKLGSRHMGVPYFVFYTLHMSEIVVIKGTSERISNNTSKWEGDRIISKSS